MSPKEVVTQALEGLNEAELRRVAEYIAFLAVSRTCSVWFAA